MRCRSRASTTCAKLIDITNYTLVEFLSTESLSAKMGDTKLTYHDSYQVRSERQEAIEIVVFEYSEIP